jgi:hypothetical protein
MTHIAGLSRLALLFLVLTMLMHLITPIDLLAQQPAPVRKLDLIIRNAHVTGADIVRPAQGAPTLRFRSGDQIDINWTVDAVMDLHLHGYRLEVRAMPGVSALMAFRARATGRFPLETHDEQGRHRTILYIEVHPR